MSDAPARTRERGGNRTVAGTAAELEYRYRGLACIQDPTNIRWEVILACTGQDALRTTGECESLSEGLLLVRPGASVEYRFAAPVGGPVRVELEQFQIAAESTVVLGGILRAGERRLGTIHASPAGARDGVVRHTFDLVLPAGTRSLVFEAKPRFGIHERNLRIARVSATSWFRHPGAPRG